MTNLDLKCDCNEGYFELVTQLHQCEVCGLDSPPVAVTKKELGPDSQNYKNFVWQNKKQGQSIICFIKCDKYLAKYFCHTI